MAGRKFWEFRGAASGDSVDAELLLYGDISDSSWWGDEVTPKQFNEDLKAMGDISTLRVRINSYGGDVFAANAIYNTLKDHPAQVKVRVDGIAASAATIIMLAGDEISMPANSMVMIHNPWTIAWGDARDMRKAADLLDSVRDTILETYQRRTGMARAELINLMNSETWMSAREAVDAGFADQVEEDAQVEASIDGNALVVNGFAFGLSRMRSVPVALLRPEIAGAGPAAGGRRASTELSMPGVSDGRGVDAPAVPAAAAASRPKQQGGRPLPSPPLVGEGTQISGRRASGTEGNGMTVKGQAEEPKVTPPAEGTSAEGQEPETAAGSESAEAQAGGEPTTQAPAETAVDAERARIKALEEMSAGMPGVEDLLVKAKYTEPMSPEQFALALVKSGKAKLAAQLAARRGDAQASGVNGVEPDARVDDSERGKATALLAKALAKVRGVQKG